MNPTYEVNIWDFNGNTQPVKLLTLAAWSCGIGIVPAIMPVVKNFLSIPDDYPECDIIDHIKTSYASIKEQMAEQ